MRKNITKVISAFKAGKAIKGDSKGTCWTDGNSVYSYSMLIAKKFLGNNGKPMYVVIDREYGPSYTTRMQIDACMNELANESVQVVREESILTWDFKFNSTH